MICNDDQHNTPASKPNTGMVPSRQSAPPTIMVAGDQMLGADGAASGATNVDTYLHALRRNWFWCLLLGCVFAGAAGSAVFFTVKDKYTAVAELRAHSSPQDLMDDGRAAHQEKFETYISSAKQLIKSRSVLSATLRRDDVKSCQVVKQEKRDEERWLASELSVSNPKDSEILLVSLASPKPKEAATIVNAVVETYLEVFEKKDREALVEKKDTLEKIQAKLLDQEKQERTALETLAEQLGTIDEGQLSMIEMEQARNVKRELIRSLVELSQAKADLELERERLANLENAEISENELKVLIAMDQEGRYLTNELQMLTNAVDHAGNLTTDPDGRVMAGLGNVRLRIQELKNELKVLGQTLTLKWKIDQRKELEEAIREKESLVRVLTTQKAEWDREFGKYGVDSNSVSRKFISIETKQKDIDRIGNEIDNVTAAIARTKLQLESRGRIELLSEARVPETANRPGRKMLSAAAGVFAFILPCVGLVFWDVRSQRVNTATEVSERLGLPIIGSVPILPSRITRRLGGSSSRGRWWQALLSESIAGIRANLLHQDDVRVVMITSAVGGEGKTTVATQLAMSLARAGKRTALIDFDLPRPSVSSVFNLDLEPGVCDILRGECGIDDAVNDTVLPNLYVLPAGVANAASTQAMNSLELPELIHDLREQFDYVVVDGSPLVPVADARVVSRYVDGAICCVLRDVSRLTMVRRASDILETFGVRLLGTVVTARHESYYMSRDYVQQQEEVLT